MLLLVGLGNPGPRHAAQRHNIGFMAADLIVRRHGFSTWRKRFQGEVAEGTLGGVRALALKPMTYMNDSGQSVGEAVRFHKLDLNDVIVFHDELDLAPGKVRVKTGGGAGGHNGIRDLDAHLGPDYRRVRMGIGHPGHKDLVHGYVLQDFSKAERESWLPKVLDAVASEAPLMAGGTKVDDEKFMSRVAYLISPPPEKPEKKQP
ncbi:aminoacyl-tRNA hydrolase [Reyranella sp. CPCC 100927]|uniref:aminoacyl-tRNA hydrolase n=1 Tax=Reyranella sp. CPCC 100927 TaxID=2599616 RepID=UPI0011B3732B|nr:aminoacyl-tRNA hydrolase [Reyranella sp. CPCC 100927]TWT03168.1 aminoacyl-tRNA hydrolase [Reyranella sp. CPCC 100927]